VSSSEGEVKNAPSLAILARFLFFPSQFSIEQRQNQKNLGNVLHLATMIFGVPQNHKEIH
jgi:hypothetical protein